jgi:hypothetical protein
LTFKTGEENPMFGKSMVGENAPNWKGGRIITSKGYVLIWMPSHPRADSRGYVPEHIVVYENYYKCCILPWASMHHKNGIKTDNRIENLELMPNHSKHMRIHHPAKNYGQICPRCDSKNVGICGGIINNKQLFSCKDCLKNWRVPISWLSDPEKYLPTLCECGKASFYLVDITGIWKWFCRSCYQKLVHRKGIVKPHEWTEEIKKKRVETRIKGIKNLGRICECGSSYVVKIHYTRLKCQSCGKCWSTNEVLEGRRFSKNNPMYGKHHTPETKKKMMLSNSNRKAVKLMHLSGRFHTTTEEEWIKMEVSTI